MPSFRELFHRKNDPKCRPKQPEYQNRDVQPRLPTTRPRALTLPLPPTDPTLNSVKQWTSAQPASPLMRLPIELRMRIYEAVLGHCKVHVAFEFGPREYRTFKRKEVLEWRWWHTICSWDQTEDDERKNVLWDHCRRGRTSGNEKAGPPNGMMGKLKLDFALLLTCRKFYSESIDILYRTTTFNFATHELLRSFPSLVLPHRFAGITSLEQTWTFLNLESYEVPAADKKLYYEMWAFVAAMPNLRHLKVAVAAFVCPLPVPANLQETWLGPIEQLRGKDMKTFEVLVPESYATHFELDEASPFKLKTFQDIYIPVCTFCTGG